MVDLDDGHENEEDEIIDMIDESAGDRVKKIEIKRPKIEKNNMEIDENNNSSSKFFYIKMLILLVILDQRLKNFIQLIFDKKMMENQLKEMEVDVK